MGITTFRLEVGARLGAVERAKEGFVLETGLGRIEIGTLSSLSGESAAWFVSLLMIVGTNLDMKGFGAWLALGLDGPLGLPGIDRRRFDRERGGGDEESPFVLGS